MPLGSSVLNVAYGRTPTSLSEPPVAGVLAHVVVLAQVFPPSHDLKTYKRFRLCVERNSSVSLSHGLRRRTRPTGEFGSAATRTPDCFASDLSVHLPAQ